MDFKKKFNNCDDLGEKLKSVANLAQIVDVDNLY